MEKLKFIALGILITLLVNSLALNVYLYTLTPMGNTIKPLNMEQDNGQ